MYRGGGRGEWSDFRKFVVAVLRVSMPPASSAQQKMYSCAVSMREKGGQRFGMVAKVTHAVTGKRATWGW